MRKNSFLPQNFLNKGHVGGLYKVLETAFVEFGALLFDYRLFVFGDDVELLVDRSDQVAAHTFLDLIRNSFYAILLFQSTALVSWHPRQHASDRR